jgi:hypothetical protein
MTTLEKASHPSPAAAAAAAADAPKSTSASRGRFASYFFGAPKLHLALIVLLSGALVAALVWRFLSVHELEGEIAAGKRDARAAMVEQSSELLRLTATPMALAIRAELLANDIGDIDAYMNKLITEKFVKRIVLVDAAGTVVSSTNIKLKDQAAAAALPGVDLTMTEPHTTTAGADLRIVVPVMDFERLIGSLVLDYSSQSIDAKLPR